MKLGISFVGSLELQLRIFEVHVSFLSMFVRSETLACLVMLICELATGMNNKSVESFLSFLESLGSSLWDVYNLSYG
jgi:hypothetical protein